MTPVERIGVWLYGLTVAVLAVVGWGSLGADDWSEAFLLAWLIVGGSWMLYLRDMARSPRHRG